MRTTLLAAAAALALSGAALAQSGGSATGTGAGTTTTGTGSMSTTGAGTSTGNTAASSGSMAQGGAWMSLNKMIDRDVVDAQGNELGEVEDVVMSRDGSNIQVVIDLEDEEKDVAVDATKLQPAQKGDDLVLQGMDKKQLAAMQAFTYESSQVGLSNQPSTRQ